MPTLPPVLLWICVLIPITRPSASSSGPPELPLLIAASVWIAPSRPKLAGDWIVRSSALTIPLVTVPARPNGLPIAITGSPTCTSIGVGELERLDVDVLARVEHRDVRRRVGADHVGLDLAAARVPDRDRVGVLDDVEVRHDAALVVEHEARALRLLRHLVAERERGSRRARRVDDDDAVLDGVVDIADRAAGGVLLRCAAGAASVVTTVVRSSSSSASTVTAVVADTSTAASSQPIARAMVFPVVNSPP